MLPSTKPPRFKAAFEAVRVLVSPQIATLESELTQLMKQNGIQVNNNNSNSTERLNAQQQSPHRAALQTGGTAPPERGGKAGSGLTQPTQPILEYQGDPVQSQRLSELIYFCQTC